MDWMWGSEYWLTRLCFQRALALVYLIGFLIVVNQYAALVGEKGLLPAPFFLKQVRFWDSPSLFYLHFSDMTVFVLGGLGVALSLVALLGISEAYGSWVSIVTWGLLWLLYLSFVNTGQDFYGFGWETLLLETGFLAIFLGPSHLPAPRLVIWLLRWVLFRVMFGAGVIKLRGDPCWRDLTCMQYHYETQPMPNPLSWYFHQLPAMVNKASVLWTHFIELVVPWGLFGPRPVRYVAGVLTILFQATLILSGNLSWLNYITIVLCIACFDDNLLAKILPLAPPELQLPWMPQQVALWGLLALIGILSVRPALNLFSRRQLMNASFDPFHIVNTYGAFGSVTRERLELIIEGTDAAETGPATVWKEYVFKGKPGPVDRRPAVISPYHLHLDWQMWFAAMGDYRDNPWVLNLVAKFLSGDKRTLSLLAENPFPNAPPRWVRVGKFVYHYAKPGNPSHAWWVREPVGQFLPPLSLTMPQFQKLLEEMGWR